MWWRLWYQNHAYLTSSQNYMSSISCCIHTRIFQGEAVLCPCLHNASAYPQRFTKYPSSLGYLGQVACELGALFALS